VARSRRSRRSKHLAANSSSLAVTTTLVSAGGDAAQDAPRTDLAIPSRLFLSLWAVPTVPSLSGWPGFLRVPFPARREMFANLVGRLRARP
jgi:hypothetical protein